MVNKGYHYWVTALAFTPTSNKNHKKWCNRIVWLGLLIDFLRIWPKKGQLICPKDCAKQKEESWSRTWNKNQMIKVST
jgi:hypothetical protein